jgi:hypothetical protein
MACIGREELRRIGEGPNARLFYVDWRIMPANEWFASERANDPFWSVTAISKRYVLALRVQST